MLARIEEIERQRQVRCSASVPSRSLTHAHPLQAQLERQQLADAMKRQKEQQRQDEVRRRRLEEDAQALVRKQTEINRRLEEAKRVQELADQERAAAQARRQQETVRA